MEFEKILHSFLGQLDPCHYNFTIFDFMLKSMPLSGMIFNVKPNFTELWWHELNFPLFIVGGVSGVERARAEVRSSERLCLCLKCEQ